MVQKVFSDQIGNFVSIPYPPRRIISLVPSQSELLFDLGLDSEVMGITKFCVHPEKWFRLKPKVGGTKNFWLDVIDQIKPELIIGNKEENYEEGIKKLQLKYPVWISDIVTFQDALDMIKTVAEMTGKETEGLSIISNIHSSFNQLLQPAHKQRALYLIWRNPWMGIGKQTFIHSMLEKAGFANVLVNHERYPELTDLDIKSLNPEVVFLSSEPFPFKEDHVTEMKHLAPNAQIKLVDGEMFSWYGSRLIKAPDYFNKVWSSLQNENQL